MEENLSALTAVEAGELADAFEKTALEIAILESVHGLRIRGGSAGDRVKRVFRASVDELRRAGTLNAMVVACTDRDGRADGPCANAERPPRDGSGGKGLPRGRRVSVTEKRLRTLRRTEEQIDLATEKCTENGERRVIRRETESNYVTKWEKSRVENVKLNFKTEELELQQRLTDLQTKLEKDKIIDAESATFLDYSINELEKQFTYWECKYKTDTIKIDERMQTLKTNLKEKTVEVENLKKMFNERQSIIDEHVRNKQKLEEEKKIIDLREKMSTKIQAWWRGTMVRRRIGPFKHLLGPRKKSIKKPTVSKGEKIKTK